SLGTSPLTPDGFSLGALFMLGDASLTVDARRDVAIETVTSPNALEQPEVPFQIKSYYFGYGENSGLTVRSNGGSITLGTIAERLYPLLGSEVANLSNFALTVLPPSLRMSALGGDVVIRDALTLFPAPLSQLDLFAARDIASEDGLILMSDAAPSA